MFGKHLLFALRRLKKNLLYTFLVVTALAVGITTFLSSVWWSAWHLSFDRSYPENSRIYRLTFEEIHDGFYRHTARILQGHALNKLIFTDMLHGIAEAGRLAPFRKAAFILGEDSYYENHAYACDPAFVEIFQPAIIRAVTQQPLAEPQTAIITESTARKFFGNEDPLGRSFEIMHQFDVRPTTYTVSAVMADFPENSHLKISVLTSFEDPIEYESTAWTYLKLEKNTDPFLIEDEIGTFLRNAIKESYVKQIHPKLQPVTDIHLHSHKAREIQPNVRFRTVLVMLLTGVFVFLLAWFNFTLLSFSQHQLQIQRMVVQWQMGAGRRIFLAGTMWEYILVGTISMVAGLTITFLMTPFIENLGGHHIPYQSPVFILSLGLLALLMFTGSFLAASFSTGRLYKQLQRKYLSTKFGAPPDSTGKSLFIRSVIVVEFIITFVLVSNLIMITRQTEFAMARQLGATRMDAIHIHSLHRAVVDNFALFKEKMEESPRVAAVTASMEEPTGQTMDANTFEINGVDEGETRFFLFPVDEDFFRFYTLEILHGSDLPETYNPLDSAEYFILNETAARMVADDPASLIGSELTLHFNYPGFIWPGPITGIVEDFHLSGLDYEISPMVIFPKYTWLFCFSILPAGDPDRTIEHLEQVWGDLFPEFPLEYHLTSEMIGMLYEQELVQMKVLLIFSILSVAIGGLGLFALSGFYMQRRMKSAALKKIHGAKVRHVVLPEILYYGWLGLLSSALAVPVSLILIERWLRNFKYRVDLAVWVFPACALLILLFSTLAVLYHTWRLARINPAEFVKEQ